jgi:hypothetical protein
MWTVQLGIQAREKYARWLLSSGSIRLAAGHTGQDWLTSYKYVYTSYKQAHPVGPSLLAMHRFHKDLNTRTPPTHSSSAFTSAPAATSAAAQS